MKSIVETIYDAQNGAYEILKVTETHKNFSVEEAYGYQRQLIDKYLSQGSRLTGYKMGLTSREKMVQMGIDAPIYGVLLDEMDIKEENLCFNQLIHPKAEPEVAVKMKNDVAMDATMEELQAAIGFIAPAIEIIDSRFKDFKFTMADVVADNCSAVYFAYGEWMEYPMKAAKIDEIAVSLEINGEPKAAGIATAVLGSPLEALRELQLSLAKVGKQIKQDQIILTGAITTAVPIYPGDEVAVKTNHIGSVAIHCAK